MALLNRISTIRAKIITGTFILILIIQVGSSVLQYFQTRSILMEEFTLGARNLVEPLNTILRDRLKNIVGEDEEINREDTVSILDAYVKMMNFEHFGSILNAKKDLIALRYAAYDGSIMAESLKTAKQAGESVSSSGEAASISSEGEGGLNAADEIVSELIKGEELASKERSDSFEVFVPFFYGDTFLGGFVLTHSKERIDSVKNRILLISIILIVIYTVISLALVFIFTNRVIIRPIQSMVRVVKKVSKGDLDNTIEIKSRDEISEIATALNDLINTLNLAFLNINNVMKEVEHGNLTQQITIDLEGEFRNLKESINTSVKMLGETIFQVRGASEQVDTGSSELARVSTEISENTNTLASTLEEISSSMAEIEKKTKDNTENSTDVQKISRETLDLVNKGNSQMESMMASINEINKTSMNVSKIIKAIDEIAFQTNLLALNAAVEAARAGKYGKGFAVVAEEVRNLAARSAEAAKDTTELIETSIREVKTGVENAEKTNTVLSEITDGVNRSNQLVNEIAEASLQQSQGISEINSGITQINEIVQRASSISEETASSSAELSGHASDLQQTIAQFRLFESEENYS